ncbi:MAG TPA: hypothetical protein PKC19_11625, partial [Roseiflexaceae bacterium]|nr:hypothetical protein [Roseiflexaceae bacterium]
MTYREQSVWLERVSFPALPAAAPLPERVDVAVIGGENLQTTHDPQRHGRWHHEAWLDHQAQQRHPGQGHAEAGKAAQD